MTGRLSGKVALVTGAAQGIGRAAAEAFASEGAVVWATDREVGPLLSSAAVHALPLDVTDPGGIRSTLDRTGPLDVLFNCAGWVANGTILDCTEEDWSRSLEVNVTPMYRMIHAALPAMLSRGTGSIINMASVASSIKGVPHRFAYCASKAAVIGLTRSVAADFAASGVRCNAICPGTVDTPSLHDRLSATGDHDEAMRAFIARQPMGRVGTAEEVAALAVYLASDESAFTTGHAHVIDGGWTA